MDKERLEVLLYNACNKILTDLYDQGYTKQEANKYLADYIGITAEEHDEFIKQYGLEED